jgi:hypothetical protein
LIEERGVMKATEGETGGGGIEPMAEWRADAVVRRCKLRDLIAQLKKLQDILGEFQDAAVQRARLLRLAEAMRQDGQPLETLLAMGVLVGHMERRQSRCREAFGEGFAAFAGKPARRRFRKLFGPGHGEGDRDRRGV